MAELKRKQAIAAGYDGLCLHGFTAVAELKLADRRHCLQQTLHVSRLHRRGRIEASITVVAALSPVLRLHGFTAVAELKRAARD